MAERCAGQVRTAGMGAPVGMELGTALKVAEIDGADPKAMVSLIPAYEAGMVAGMRKKAHERHEEPRDPA
ncbi:hypothetical protein [Roseomonas genomospecies 6]|uniref:Uncharacterized protein n=1 Tax=Roseomonas genomospecies 6 TaxID=214106 RepID=A0A9W7NGR6_9PROT|nr:hypothetical protein [Roseomonas genomospecies 6]KAA0677785.1 hypothetical protein DS843_21945 [Roseomonas genomospecies 6]